MTDPAAPAPDGGSPSADRSDAPDGDDAAEGGSVPHAAPVHPPAPHASPAPYSAPAGHAAPPYGLAPAPVPPAPASIAYGQQVFAVAPPKGLSITSMVLGLVSVLFFWTFLCPVIGLVFGIIGIRREPAGRGFAIAGIVLNGVLLIIPVVVVLFLVLTAGATVLGVATTTGR